MKISKEVQQHSRGMSRRKTKRITSLLRRKYKAFSICHECDTLNNTIRRDEGADTFMADLVHLLGSFVEFDNIDISAKFNDELILNSVEMKRYKSEQSLKCPSETNMEL